MDKAYNIQDLQLLVTLLSTPNISKENTDIINSVMTSELNKFFGLESSKGKASNA